MTLQCCEGFTWVYISMSDSGSNLWWFSGPILWINHDSCKSQRVTFTNSTSHISPCNRLTTKFMETDAIEVMLVDLEISPQTKLQTTKVLNVGFTTWKAVFLPITPSSKEIKSSTIILDKSKNRALAKR